MRLASGAALALSFMSVVHGWSGGTSAQEAAPREPVTTAETWWKVRRPEVVEDFEREVVGRVPPNVPKVT
jgi:hypothetical protein